MTAAVITTLLDVDGWEKVRTGYGVNTWTHPSGAVVRVGAVGRITAWTQDHPSLDATFAPGACPVGVAAYLHALTRQETHP